MEEFNISWNHLLTKASIAFADSLKVSQLFSFFLIMSSTENYKVLHWRRNHSKSWGNPAMGTWDGLIKGNSTRKNTKYITLQWSVLYKRNYWYTGQIWGNVPPMTPSLPPLEYCIWFCVSSCLLVSSTESRGTPAKRNIERNKKRHTSCCKYLDQ